MCMSYDIQTLDLHVVLHLAEVKILPVKIQRLTYSICHIRLEFLLVSPCHTVLNTVQIM